LKPSSSAAAGSHPYWERPFQHLLAAERLAIVSIDQKSVAARSLDYAALIDQHEPYFSLAVRNQGV
jgi:hypothetical protein